jgi:two-component system chemotaxis response regulator CheY
LTDDYALMKEIRMRAIVIDDSRAMRGLIKRVLLTLGFEVFEGCDGSDGLKRLAEGPPPALAMVDWNMPNMNGLELVQAVRKNPVFDAMRIMMVTTEVEMHQVEAALAAGANEYLMKPFTEDVLREKILMLNLVREAA